MSTIGERILNIRKENHLNQTEFGKLLGVSQTHISKIEKNLENPSLPLIKLICKLFTTNEEWLLSGSGNKSLIIGSSEEGTYNRVELVYNDFKNGMKKHNDEMKQYYSDSIEYLTNILNIINAHSPIEMEYCPQYLKSISEILRILFLMSINKNEITQDNVYYFLSRKQVLSDKIQEQINSMYDAMLKINGINLDI